MHRHRTTKFCVMDVVWTCLQVSSAALLCAATASAAASSGNDAAYAHMQRRVDIGAGRKLNLYCVESGAARRETVSEQVRESKQLGAQRQPTVIFESGLSDWSFTWAQVQARIATTTRACSYDRAGLGYSDPSRRAASAANTVDDLHRLLQRAALAPPYVLVGHSLGALYARLYQARYPAEVAGLVLLDPVVEDSTIRLDRLRRGAESRRLFAQVRVWQKCARDVERLHATEDWQTHCIEPDDRHYGTTLNAARRAIAQQPSYQRAQVSEALHYANGLSQKQLRAATHDDRSVPIRILSAPRRDPDENRIWLSLHQDIAARSANGLQITIPTAGHYIQLDVPDAVIEAINAVLESVGNGEAATKPIQLTPLQDISSPAP